MIGRAVNEACRMEALCDEIGRNIVLSEVFADRCASETEAVGAFSLRGIAGRRTVHAVADHRSIATGPLIPGQSE